MIQNLEKINVIKRDKVLAGCKFVDKINRGAPVVQKIVIFGSAVTDDCTQDSDIDICLFSDFDTSNPAFFQIYGGLPLVMDDICDILVYKRTAGKIAREIVEKGVVVYECEPD